MIDRVIPESELTRYSDGSDLASRARGLLRQQKATWEILHKGYASLDTVKTRAFTFDGVVVHVQYNPGRLTSSAAKVDLQSISERRCFLCPQNLPEEQRGLLYRDAFLILCNPFPIFPEHFTISFIQHTPQQIRTSFQTLLDLSKEMSKHYTVFYNGPKCGASAPDHLHFQAGNKYFMPIDEEYRRIRDGLAERLGTGDALRVYSLEKYLRRFISLESEDDLMLVRAFELFYDALREVASDTDEPRDEPMMNILATYDDGAWRVILFPRARHRPSFFYHEGEGRILLSPAAVDLGGVCITPLERDFERITSENIIEMFDEVCVSGDVFGRLKECFARSLAVI